jgi:hypothetical protein
MNTCVEKDPFDLDILFPGHSVKNPAIGFVEVPTGILNTSSKIAFYAVAEDPLKVHNCKIVLEKFFDGSPIAVRYEHTNIHFYKETV